MELEDLEHATPEVGGYPLASPGQRLGAMVIDVVIAQVAYALVSAGLVMSIFYAPQTAVGFARILFKVPVPVVAFTVVIAVMVFLQGGLWWWRSQSIGKCIMGLRVVNADGRPAPAWKQFLRSYYYLELATPYLGALVALDGAMYFRGGSRTCFHDKLTDSYVVRTKPANTDPLAEA